MNIITVFNNKGGVGKTTYLYHIANLLADKGKKVLMVDGDSQCNLTAYTLADTQIARAWAANGNSIYRVIEAVSSGTGDIKKRKPTKVNDNLHIIPGDIDLSTFEDRLGATWDSAGISELSFRTQVALYRYIILCAHNLQSDFVLIDLGPNLGALNRALLGGSDYFITPLSPDLFSIRGTENLGNKLATWHEEWENILRKWRVKGSIASEIAMPNGKPKFFGYVMQQHNIRRTKSGMTKGWELFGEQVDSAVRTNIVDKLAPLSQVVLREAYMLAKIPNLHSLIPYSQHALKPIYKCTYKDGLRGEHISTAKDSKELYDDIINLLMAL